MAQRTWLKYKRVHGSKPTVLVTFSAPPALKAALRDLSLSETILLGEEVSMSSIVATILLGDEKLKKLYQKYESATTSK